MKQDLTTYQVGYIAGLIDGEGCLTLVPKGRFQPVVDITSTNERMIDWLVNEAEIGSKIPNRTKHKPAWHCRVYSPEKVLELLKSITLIAKREQQLILFDVCHMLIGWIAYDRARMNELYLKIRELNKR